MTRYIDPTEWQEFDLAGSGWSEQLRRSGWPLQAGKNLPLTHVTFNPCCPLLELPPTLGFRVRVNGLVVVEGPWWMLPPAPTSRSLRTLLPVPEGAVLRVELTNPGVKLPSKLPVYLIFSGVVEIEEEPKP